MTDMMYPEPGTDLSRPTYWSETVEQNDDYGHKVKTEVRKEVPAAQANLVGSKVNDNIHLPLFDIDYNASLHPSTTPGHYHLYLNKPITWRKYKRVIKAMAKAGLVQDGFCKYTIQRKQAFLRPPGVKKGG
jgi:hypothetical protein